ncbi:MAG: alpha/beta fold hydrolase [Bacteriovoracia bacterium]
MQIVQKNISIRGLRTAWLQAEQSTFDSDSPIFFFLHGCPDTPESWTYQLRHFAQFGTSIAPYARGIELSEPSDQASRYGFDAIALDNLEILNAIDPSQKRPVVVIGHDIGGPNAWKLASLVDSKRLKGLVLINSTEYRQFTKRLSNLRQVLKSWYMFMFQLPFSRVLVRKMDQNLFQLALKKGDLQNRSFLVSEQRDYKVLPFLEQYKQGLRSIRREWKKSVPILEKPALILCGKEDKFLELPTQDEMKTVSINPTIRVISGGHWIHLDQPDKVNKFIESFVFNKPIEKAQPRIM